MKNKKPAFSGWESEDEKLRRYMNVPPEEKLKAIRQMNEFMVRFSSKKTRAIRQRLRQIY